MVQKYISVLLLFVCFHLQAIQGQEQKDKAVFDLSKNLTIYHNILKEVNLLYVDSVDNTKLIQKGIESMLRQLDPYTLYIPESDVADFKTQTTGEYGGIGALVGKRDDYVVILEVYKGLPADKAGLKAGDKVIALNGKDTKGFEIKEVTDIMKGKVNAPFTITVERPYAQRNPIKLTITRGKIQLDCVPYATILDGNIGYLAFTNFTNKAEKRMRETVKKLKADGATSLIIDVRGNPGGLLDQAIKVCNLFIDKNQTIVATKGRISQWDRSYQTTKKALDAEIPIVVLTNSGSASASEILAGAIQDLDRGVVMGTHSFGKGLVQTTRELGYNSKLKVTTSKYYIPSGRCIQALDYTHRNEDGSVGHIPDSLITAFKTTNGRTVYDGGGIMPDVKIAPEKYSDLTVQLLQNHQITDFATKYANTHEAATNPFRITDAIYDDFINFVTSSSSFEYESSSYKAFKKLQKIIKEEKKEKKPDLTALEKQLKPKLQRDLELYKEKIKDLIEYQINIRQFYQKGGYAQAVNTDFVIKEAVKLLKDKKRYEGILDGTVPAASSKKQKQEKQQKE